jgi:hypothetical protein
VAYKKNIDMTNLCAASLRIGVTGHRKFENDRIVRDSVKSVLRRLDEFLENTLNNTPYTYIVISPLAEGADRLVAKEVLDWNTSGEKTYLEVVLPLQEQDYLTDFTTAGSREEFRELLAIAKSVHVLEKAESRETAYENVGHYVVDSCDFLIAIWDGKPAEGKGGTAKIVEYARNIGKHVFWINSNDGKIEEEKNEGKR